MTYIENIILQGQKMVRLCSIGSNEPLKRSVNHIEDDLQSNTRIYDFV